MKTEMKMRVWESALALAMVCFSAGAAEPEWENLAVNSINRLPARTYSMPLDSEDAAFTDALEPVTPYKKSLNGEWKFSWAGNPELRVRDFERVDFDDSAWFTIDVPSCVEMRGFGAPGYTNVRYPHANKWPKILDRETGKPDYNPVSSYRTRFTIPAEWKGREVILRFDGVYSAYYVWVNGKRVGYAEDSKLPSEFNITPYLNAGAGDNLLAVEVYRWCDGSYLEDQDMFRFSGIYRDVTLWAKPKEGIWDFAVRTALAADYKSAKLDVEGIDGSWTATLYDAARKPVAQLSSGASTADVADVQLWSAEKPYLYTLVLKRGEDIRMKRIGFKEQKIVGSVFKVNGQPVKFKGVNRHETNPENGRTVSLADMVADIELMKRYNFNTVRTSHYPDHHLWYDLCDRYGIYIVAEANVEGHEPGYGKESLGLFPEWDHTIVERNERNVVFHRDHPCVTLWSLGNETGHGDCFRHAIAAVKKLDPSRPVHWERGNKDADVDSTMYPTVEWLEHRGQLGDATSGGLKSADGGVGFCGSDHTAGKCFFLCEYAHAMGNAVGNFAEYWDVFYKYDSLSGGCIWDWVDQAVWKQTGRMDPKTGKPERILAYGGDFDEAPNDGPFCCNGVVDPLRRVSAKLVEIGHVQRNLVVTRADEKGKLAFELWNRFCFTSADEFSGLWRLRENGVVVKTGAFSPLALKPLSRGQFSIPELSTAVAAAKPGAELLVEFEFATRRDACWAKAGWVVARDQIAVSDSWKFPSALASAKPTFTSDERTLTAEIGTTRAVFCRKSGTLSELVLNGKTILRDPTPGVVAGPQFTIERAFTDNDIWMRQGEPWKRVPVHSFYDNGLAQLRYHARPFEVGENTVKITVEVTSAKSAAFTHESTWSFADDGSIHVAHRVTPRGTFPQAIPREGLSLVLDPSLENLQYYGRGPRENYIDRCTGSFLGLWRSTVAEQFEFYVRPQDNGAKSDVRWVAFADAAGKGVKFSASQPLFFQSLHFCLEDLEFARHRNGQQRFNMPLAARPEIYLKLDVRQTGLGGASCGPVPMDKYRFDPKSPVAWTLHIEPWTADAADSRVELRDCPKCDSRIKIDLAAGKAYVNRSRAEDVSLEALAARAERLLDLAKIPPAKDPKIRPLMGWSSWNTFGVDISESIILETARAMATNGLKDAGYVYVNIDDGFFWGHDEKGNLRFHPERFPNGMKGTVDGIHALGLKAGTYSDAGADTCGSMWGGGGSGGKDKGGVGAGLYGHDAADCKLHFNELGFDFIKVDYCGGQKLKLDERVRYTEIAEAIKATGRTDVRLNLCRWAFPGTWAAEIAESWRTTGDIRANWNSVKKLIGENLYLGAYAKPGHYNDMDMLEVGQLVGKMKSVFGAKHGDTGLTKDEETTHFGMWCMLSSPLLIGCDVRTIPAETKALITNPYLLAVNQNDLGIQASVVQRAGDACILAKDAFEKFGKSRYVALYNGTDAEHEFVIRADELDLDGVIDAFDLVAQADVGRFTGEVTVKVAPHASRFYLFDAERRLQRRVYEAESAYLTSYQELVNAKEAATPYPDACAEASCGMVVRGLGGRPENDLIWQDVAINDAGLYSFAFDYQASEDGFFVLALDGGTPQRVVTRATGGKMGSVLLSVKLQKGVHRVRLSNAQAPMAILDRLVILPARGAAPSDEGAR